jgi:hypothetical protein
MILQCVSNDEELDIEPLKGVMTPLRSSQLLFQLQSPMRDPAFNGFLVERRYAETEEFLVQNPRSQYVKLFPSDVCQLPQYEGMNSWFRDNAESKTKPFISSLEAAFNAYLDVRSDDVWMVFTAHANPGLLYD